MRAPTPKTHIVTLSWDDGFRKSAYRVADLFQRNGFRAALNVIATGHLPSFARLGDPWIDYSLLGDFTDWNKLARGGHEVMPHSYDHTDLSKLALPDAKRLIDRCAQAFEANLRDFRASEAIYSFAYNSSTPELEAYALTKFLAIRASGEAVQPLPEVRQPTRLGCISHGPGVIDDFFDAELERFLTGEGGWFVFNTHGLDDEGWGPMTSDYLAQLLPRLRKMPHVAVRPPVDVLTTLPKPSM